MCKEDERANYFQLPPEGAKLYKIMRFENFEKSINEKFLYFHRVDKYNDDIYDSYQTPSEKEKNQKVKFEKDLEFNYGELIDRQRKRTYACCFSTEHSDYLWDTYSYRDQNAVCLVFDCFKMMSYIKKIYCDSRVLLKEEIVLQI